MVLSGLPKQDNSIATFWVTITNLYGLTSFNSSRRKINYMMKGINLIRSNAYYIF
jgi:hypothetical protein